MILAGLNLISSVFMNRLTCSSENFSPQSGTDFPLLLTVLFVLNYSWYLGNFVGIRHVWSLKHATSILLPCFILTWHPKWPLNNFLQILTPGSKKACHVMTILTWIPCILSQQGFIQNTFFNANFGWLNLYWCQLSVNWRTVPKRYLSHILCRNPWGNSSLCTLAAGNSGRSGSRHPATPGHVHGSSVDLLRSQGNSIRHGESGEKPICFLFLSPFPEAPLGEIHLTVSAVQDIFNPLSRKPYEGKYLLSPKELPAWTSKFH